MVDVSCFKCSKIFKVYKYRLKKTKHFYCTNCYKTERKLLLGKYIHIGQAASQKKIREVGLSEKQLKGLEKGRYKGKRMNNIGRAKMSQAWKEGRHPVTKSMRKGLSSRWGKEEKSPHWKGDEVGYVTLHEWVAKHLGRPKKCEHCGVTEGKFQWANKSQFYKRDLSDWLRLCIFCHRKYDAQFKDNSLIK